MTKLTDAQLSELLTLEEKATPKKWYQLGAPWSHSDHDGLAIVAGNPDPHKGTLIAEFGLSCDWTEGDDDPRIQENRDARFVCAARNSIRPVVEEVLYWRAKYGSPDF